MDPTIQLILDLATKNADHIETINREMGVVITQVENLMWWFRIIAAAIIGLLVTQFWQISKFRKFNNNSGKNINKKSK